MSKMRIYEIAKELDADNNDVLELLKKKGFDISSSLCSIETDEKLLKEIKTEIKMIKEDENKKPKLNVETDKEEAKTIIPKKENTLIKAEELTKETEKPSSKEKKEKLSVFYKTNEESIDTVADTHPTPKKTIHSTFSNKKAETEPSKTNFFTNTVALTGLIVSITAIVITLNMYSKNLFVPQRVNSLIKSQDAKSGDLALIKNELRNLEKKFEKRLNNAKKADLVVQLSVIKELANNSSGQIKMKLQDIERNIVSLINEMD